MTGNVLFLNISTNIYPIEIPDTAKENWKTIHVDENKYACEQYKRSPTDENLHCKMEVIQHTNDLRDHLQSTFIHDSIEGNKGNAKNTWQSIKSSGHTWIRRAIIFNLKMMHPTRIKATGQTQLVRKQTHFSPFSRPWYYLFSILETFVTIEWHRHTGKCFSVCRTWHVTLF